MTKIFKQLARHWAVCLVVFALLFVQAYCDLSLPDYTSKIVDTGIQQGGIESPLPDTVRQSTLDALSLLMREEDAAAFQNAYTADGDVLRLRTDLTADERTALEDAVTTPDIVLYLAAAQAANTPAGQTGMGMTGLADLQASGADRNTDTETETVAPTAEDLDTVCGQFAAMSQMPGFRRDAVQQQLGAAQQARQLAEQLAAKQAALAAAQPDAARATLFRNVYLWMTMALALTALTAYTVAGSETLLQAIFSSRFVFLGLIVAELVLVFVLAANIMRMSFLTATLMFIAYSVVNGATLSTIFLVYDLGSIGLTFLVTAGMFGAMSLYGFVTGRDLSSWGNLLTMALVGVILASVVNLFLRSEMLMWIVTYVGILLFVGLTAYDTQTIKRMIYSGAEVDEPMQKMALLGALSLYLDFINLFLYMLRLLGNRR